MQNNKYEMFTTFVILFSFTILIVLFSQFTQRVDAADPKITGWTDLLAIERTSIASISTPVKLVGNGGVLVLNNESDNTIRMSKSADDCLTNGLGIPAGAVVSIRFWDNQEVWVGCATESQISYMRGR